AVRNRDPIVAADRGSANGRGSVGCRGGCRTPASAAARTQLADSIADFSVCPSTLRCRHGLRSTALVMMRVTRIQDGKTPPRLHVEGRLTHETTEELTMECHALMKERGSFDLDVSALQFADSAGVATLLDLERGGVRLQRRAGLVDALLRDGDCALVERLRA